MWVSIAPMVSSLTKPSRRFEPLDRRPVCRVAHQHDLQVSSADMGLSHHPSSAAARSRPLPRRVRSCARHLLEFNFRKSVILSITHLSPRGPSSRPAASPPPPVLVSWSVLTWLPWIALIEPLPQRRRAFHVGDLVGLVPQPFGVEGASGDGGGISINPLARRQQRRRSCRRF